jgi:hypothetical protein
MGMEMGLTGWNVLSGWTHCWNCCWSEGGHCCCWGILLAVDGGGKGRACGIDGGRLGIDEGGIGGGGEGGN